MCITFMHSSPGSQKVLNTPGTQELELQMAVSHNVALGSSRRTLNSVSHRAISPAPPTFNNFYFDLYVHVYVCRFVCCLCVGA